MQTATTRSILNTHPEAQLDEPAPTGTVRWTERAATVTDPGTTDHRRGDRLPLSDAVDASTTFGQCTCGISFDSSTREVLWESDLDDWGRTGAARVVDESPAEHIGLAL